MNPLKTAPIAEHLPHIPPTPPATHSTWPGRLWTSPSRSLHHRPLRPPRRLRRHGRRRPGHPRRHRHEALRQKDPHASTRTRSSPDSPAPPPTPSPSSRRFESKLEQYAGNLSRAAVELAKDWRTDKMLRHLEALLIVTDLTGTFVLSGNGDVIEPEEGIIAIGSGGSYALAAARALIENTDFSAREIAEKSLKIAGQICIYTNIRPHDRRAQRNPHAASLSKERPKPWQSFSPEPQKTRPSRSTR